MSGLGLKGARAGGGQGGTALGGASSMSNLWNWMGTGLALTGILRGILPNEYREAVSDWARRWIAILSRHAFFVVREFEGAALNELYLTVQTYLSGRTAAVALVSNLFQPRNAKEITFSLATDQRVLDTFEGAQVEWTHIVREKKAQTVVSGNDPNGDEKRLFQLKMKRADKDRILEGYLAHIAERSKEILRQKRELQLYTNKGKRGKAWEAVPFLHPATFDSLALEPALKSRILEDLEEFVDGEEFYRRVGKSWKRGYLLFGPPGTGKSSMIAAIANKLRYDVYDLELTEVESNAELRRMLLQTTNKSIIVIEDIDCSLDLSGQRKPVKAKGGEEDFESVQQQLLQQEKQVREDTSRVTLSGLLNFTDGLWSSSGAERIFIFTTNFVEKLDPALLRPGRMDMHISLSYCTFYPFKVLAKNFLQISDHPLYPDVEREIEGCPISPAEVGEVLTSHRKNADKAMEALLEKLRVRKSEGPKKIEPEIAEIPQVDDWRTLSLKQSQNMFPSANGVRSRRPESGGGREGGWGRDGGGGRGEGGGGRRSKAMSQGDDS